MITQRKLQDILVQLKNHWEEKTEYSIRKDHLWEAEMIPGNPMEIFLKRDDEELVFSVLYFHHTEVFSISFEYDEWTEAYEPLARQLAQECVLFLQAHQIDCFFETYSDYGFYDTQFVGFEFPFVSAIPFVPISAKGSLVMELLQKIPLTYDGLLVVDEPYSHFPKLEVVPCLVGTPSVLFYQRDSTMYYSTNQYDKETLVERIVTIDEYQTFIATYQTKEQELNEINEAVQTWLTTTIPAAYASIITDYAHRLSLNTSNRFVVRDCNYTDRIFDEKEEVIRYIQTLYEHVLLFEQHIASFFARLDQTIPMSFVQANYTHHRNEYLLQIGTEKLRMQFSIRFQIHPFTRIVRPSYYVETDDQTLKERTMEQLVEEIYKRCKKCYDQIRMTQLFAPDSIEYLPKLKHEFQCKDVLFPDHLASKIKYELTKYYQDPMRTPLDQEMTQLVLGSLELRKQNNILVFLEHIA